MKGSTGIPYETRIFTLIEGDKSPWHSKPFVYVQITYVRMSSTGANDGDPEIDRINLRISRSFLEVIDEAWLERGFNSRSEFIRYALREAVNHPEGAGFWKDLAISEAEFAEGEGLPSQEVKEKHGLTGE